MTNPKLCVTLTVTSLTCITYEMSRSSGCVPDYTSNTIRTCRSGLCEVPLNDHPTRLWTESSLHMSHHSPRLVLWALQVSSGPTGGNRHVSKHHQPETLAITFSTFSCFAPALPPLRMPFILVNVKKTSRFPCLQEALQSLWLDSKPLPSQSVP